ncbi:hypothetical protein QR685DRAFT_567640 [Neurospora intermedia]|uniref:Uncharacterized protein n=1 Tax=Neurospora intermedia TaxID=5142 RepID=A0ABR3DPY8_NEUIN
MGEYSHVGVSANTALSGPVSRYPTHRQPTRTSTVLEHMYLTYLPTTPFSCSPHRFFPPPLPLNRLDPTNCFPSGNWKLYPRHFVRLGPTHEPRYLYLGSRVSSVTPIPASHNIAQYAAQLPRASSILSLHHTLVHHA